MFEGEFSTEQAEPSGTTPRRPMDFLFGSSRGLGRRVSGFGSVGLRQKERSTYILGTHGSGKSTLVLNRILEDITQGEEAVIVLDPHGDLARQVLLRVPPEHAGRVVLFDPLRQRDRPLGLNPFEWYDEVEYYRKVEAVVNVFAYSWYGTFRSTPTLQSVLTTLVRTLFEAYREYRTHFAHLQMILREDEVGEWWRRKLSALTQSDLALEAKWTGWKSGRPRQAAVPAAPPHRRGPPGAAPVRAATRCRPRSR